MARSFFMNSVRTLDAQRRFRANVDSLKPQRSPHRAARRARVGADNVWHLADLRQGGVAFDVEHQPGRSTHLWRGGHLHLVATAPRRTSSTSKTRLRLAGSLQLAGGSAQSTTLR